MKQLRFVYSGYMYLARLLSSHMTGMAVGLTEAELHRRQKQQHASLNKQ